MATIILTTANLRRLRALFPQRDRIYIWRALNFKINSPDAKRIRHIAVAEFDGIYE